MEQNLERLQEAERYLSVMQEAIQTMIDDLKLEDTDDIFHMLGMLSEGIEWLLAVFELTKEMQVEEIDISDINDTVATLIEGMENKDWMLLADCLEYSLLDQVEAWKQSVRITLDEYQIPSL